VSSPGVDRPLTETRHWSRAAGHLVSVEMIDGKPPEVYRVIGIENDIISLTDSHDETLNIPVSEIKNAVVQIEFNRGD
jgi:ribosome maturation factor RimP